MKCDAVFQGGGGKGIGIVGALAAIEKAGYEFINLAGSSAGAIVSALLAVGYNSDEMKAELNELDYLMLKQEGLISKFGTTGKIINMVLKYGMYSADYFENWLESLLKRKNKTLFKDIQTDFAEEKYRYKFNAIASDLTDKKMLVLPGDLKQFGYNPGDFSIAKAVRMSMSMPVFFAPFKLKDMDGKEHIIVDGGILSNYPIWLLDDNSKNPPWPTFGFKFNTDIKSDLYKTGAYEQAEAIKNIFDYAISLLHTMLDAHDKFHISNSSGDFERTILISSEVKNGGNKRQISSTDFDIKPAECDELFANGFSSAEKFLATWNFDEWIKKYRS
ncbi:MAG: patatin-like phospholipase family protein [Clostridiales bacterium]|nr:patatin-like phospholipase family protein [Clostridiales bacterium]